MSNSKKGQQGANSNRKILTHPWHNDTQKYKNWSNVKNKNKSKGKGHRIEETVKGYSLNHMCNTKESQDFAHWEEEKFLNKKI